MAGKRGGIDTNIYIFLAFIIGICLIVLVFKSCRSKSACNESSDFIVSPSTIYVNAPVSFKFSGNDSDPAEWDFGDHSDPAKGNSVSHIYMKADSFEVTMSFNGKCPVKKKIKVLGAITPVVDLPKPAIDGPTEVAVGAKVQFKENSGNGKSWEWYFGETGGIDSREQNPTYTFSYPGNKMISVLINGNSKGTLALHVKPAPPTGGNLPSVPTKSEFLAMLNDCQNRKIEISSFEKCTGRDLAQIVSVIGANGQKDNQQFSTYLQMHRMQPVEIAAVEFTVDPHTHYISNIIIHHK